jgi:hypothetical protein
MRLCAACSQQFPGIALRLRRFVISESYATHSETAAMITASMASTVSAQWRSRSEGRPFSDMRISPKNAINAKRRLPEALQFNAHPSGDERNFTIPTRLARSEGFRLVPTGRSLLIEIVQHLLLRRHRELTCEVDVRWSVAPGQGDTVLRRAVTF